jgi:hypothetical protein
MAYSRRVWPLDFERAEDALVRVIKSGREEPWRALERILLAWQRVST